MQFFSKNSKNYQASEDYNPYRQFFSLCTPDWIAERPELSLGAKMCFGQLAGFAGKNGKCYPSHAALSKKLGVSERQTIRYIRELEKNRLIRVERQGFARSNRYFFIRHPWMEGRFRNDAPPEVTDTSLHMMTDMSPEKKHIKESETTTTAKAPASVVVVSSEPEKKLREKPDTVLQAGSKAGKAAVPEEIPNQLQGKTGLSLQAHPEPERLPEPEDRLASVLKKIPEEYRKKLTPLIRAKLKAGKTPEVIVANALYSIAHKPQKLQAYTGCAIDKDYAGSSGWVPEDVQQEAQAALKAQQERLQKEAEEESLRQQNVEKENALREKARERFKQMPTEEQQKLRNAFLKQAKPFEVRRFLKMRAMEILKNIAFMDFIAMDHACVSP